MENVSFCTKADIFDYQFYPKACKLRQYQTCNTTAGKFYITANNAHFLLNIDALYLLLYQLAYKIQQFLTL